jgi:hypothetical protein
VAAIVAAIFATMVARWNLGLPRLVFSPELAPVHRRIEALEQFNRDTRLLAPTPRHALAGDGCGVRDVRWWRPASGGAAARGRHSGVE